MGLLYKYYGFEAGLAALRYQTLGFRNPNALNDPMEFKIWLRQHGVENPSWFSMLNESVGVLSLTRNIENPLVWSHYADEHRGFVIGYDESEPLFNNEQVDTVISASNGDVLYDKADAVENADKMGLAAFQWMHFGMGDWLGA